MGTAGVTVTRAGTSMVFKGFFVGFFFLATGGLVVGAGRATNPMGNLVCVGCASRSIPFLWSNVNMLPSINLDLKEVSLPPST